MASKETLEIMRKLIDTRRKATAARSKELAKKHLAPGSTLMERIPKMTLEELDALLEESKKPKEFGTIWDFLALMPGFARTDDGDDDATDPTP